MSYRSEDSEYDLHQMIVKPLYFGLFVNIVVPMALLLVCYYLTSNHYMDNRAGDLANPLFYFLGVLSVGQAGFALWWRSKLFQRPMIRRKETFEQDMAEGLLRNCRPVFAVIAAISLYGYLYFFLTGRFNEAVFIVFFSFLVFQVVRPRLGSLSKLLAHQKDLVEKGQFLSP